MIDIPRAYLAGLGAVVLLVLASAAAAGGWMARGWKADRDIAELQALHAQERERHANAARAAEAKAREIEQSRQLSIERIERESFSRNQAIQADAASARAAADSLRKHIARLAGGGSASSDSGAADISTTAAGTGLVLADVLGRSVDRTVELAAFADAAHAAGLACERSFQAVRTP